MDILVFDTDRAKIFLYDSLRTFHFNAIPLQIYQVNLVKPAKHRNAYIN